MLRVLSLNIGSLFEQGWEQRRHEIVAWIDRLDCDVVCMQEVWEGENQPNTAGWIAEHSADAWHGAFGGFGFGAFAERDPSFRFGSAVMSRWPIDSSEVHELPTASNPDEIVATMPWELLHVRTAGLDLYSTHLAPAPTHGRHRVAQVLAIDEIIRTSRGEADSFANGMRRDAMPPLLCGDFNAEPDSDEIRFLRGLTPIGERTTFFQDSWAVAGDGGPGLTQDWQTHPLAAGLNVHRKRIDYIFVGDPFLRAGDGGRVASCTVACDTPLTGVQASDHMGLLAEVVWPQRPSAPLSPRN